MPSMRALARTHACVQVDVDEFGEVAASANVTAMPTFQFMRNGSLLETIVGADPDKLTQSVERLSE